MICFGRWLPRLVIESILIVVSVLVALAVNDWKAGRERSVRAAEARAAFTKEIASNRALLTSGTILGHHRRLQAEYTAKWWPRAEPIQARCLKPECIGRHSVMPRGAAFQRQHLDDFAADDVLLLSDIYHAQADLERRDGDFLAARLMPRADRDTLGYQRDSARSLTLFLNDLVPVFAL